MGRASPILTNFTAGELSPAMLGRVDVQRYFHGAQQLENFYVKPQGGAFRRPGTKYMGEVKDSADATILVPFEFNNEQAYMLELGDLYCRVWANGSLLLNNSAATLELTTPWVSADLDELYWAQSADTLYLCHPDHQPRTILRSATAISGADSSATQAGGAIFWGIKKFEFFDGPYLDEDNPNNIQISATARINRVKLIARTASTMAATNLFQSGDVNVRHVEYKDNITGDWKIGLVVGLLDANGDTTATSPTPGALVTEYPVATPDARVVLRFADFVSPGKAWFNFSNPFTRADTNAFVRMTHNAETGDSAPGSGVWAKITEPQKENGGDYEPDEVGFNGAVAVPAMRTYSWPTTVVTILTRIRTCSIKASSAVFNTTDEGRWLRLNLSGKYLAGKISGTPTTTSATLDLDPDETDYEFPLDSADADSLQDGGVTDRWQLGAWCSELGWPSCVTFHEQRLVFAATDTQPQTIWMSQSGDYPNFAPSNLRGEVTDDASINYTIASNKVNKIVWLESGATMLVGTIGGEWQVRAASAISEPITPSNIAITPQSAFGSIDMVRPFRVNNAVFFVQRSGRKLRELTYNFELDSFVAKDMTVLSEHILRDGTKVVDSAWQSEPNGIAWFVLDDGTLAGLTIDRDQEVYAWHRHTLGGTDAAIESIACIPASTGLEWELWMIVARTVNGTAKRFVERLGAEFNPASATDKDGMIYLDCHATYDSTATLTPTGFGHLNGETVNVVADGAIRASETVASGTFTMDFTGAVVHAGFGYTSTIHTMPVEGGGMFGTSQGKTKRVDTVGVRLLNSIGFKHGPSASSLELVSFRDTTDAMDTSPPLFTGDKPIRLGQGYDTDGSFFIVQDQAYPLNVLALMPEIVSYE